MIDREARFRRLFDAHYGSLHAFARRRIAPAEVDDLVADVLTTAWRRLDDVPEDAELPWLYGVARGTLANQRRSSERRLRLIDRLRTDLPSQAPDAPPATPAPGPVLAALERLRPADRTILQLAAWEGLRPAELAVVLGCGPNAAALRLSRARKRFRAELTGTDASRTSQEWKVTDG